MLEWIRVDLFRLLQYSRPELLELEGGRERKRARERGEGDNIEDILKR